MQTKFFKIFSVFFIFLGVFFIFYDILLIFLSPGTFWDNVFSFSHIWSIFGSYFIFVGIYRLKKQHSFWKIWKKWIKITFVILFSLGFLICVVSLGFILNPKTVDISESSDYVILLGGGIDKNGKLPSTVNARVQKAAEYLKLHQNVICVVTGGTLHWLPYAEAPEIKRQLVLAGIPQERVLIEDQALDTIQNFQKSLVVLENFTGKSKDEILNSKIIVVTSNFHLRRAERLAKRLGFTNVKGIASKTDFIKIPNSYLREICAYLKLNLRILFTNF